VLGMWGLGFRVWGLGAVPFQYSSLFFFKKKFLLSITSFYIYFHFFNSFYYFLASCYIHRTLLERHHLIGLCVRCVCVRKGARARRYSQSVSYLVHRH
jgi:hypothetical protein